MDNLRNHITSIAGPLDEQSWTVLRNCLQEWTFLRNDLLLKEGEICKSIFFISSGFCKSWHNVDGKKINTAFYFENEFATNIKSLTTSLPSEYSIQVCEKTHAVRIDRAKLLEAYGKSSQIEHFGRRALEQIIVKQEEHSDTFKLLLPRERFEALVSKYPSFLQRVSLTEIASYLGISRETLSRFRAAR